MLMTRPGMSALHLRNVRSLPSCISGGRPCEAHHLIGGPAARERGVARKASDRWAVPLTWDEHNLLHTHGSKLEGEFFAQYGVDPYALAEALWAARHDRVRMERIVRRLGWE